METLSAWLLTVMLYSDAAKAVIMREAARATVRMRENLFHDFFLSLINYFLLINFYFKM